MMMLLLAVFIINSVHINSHHVSGRTVERLLCCRNISVQFWRVNEVNFDDVKIETNACHCINWCHIHNLSSAIPLKWIEHELKRESAGKLGSDGEIRLLELVCLSVEDDWCSVLRHLFLAAELLKRWQMMLMMTLTAHEKRSIILKARAAINTVFLCHCSGLFTLYQNVWTHLLWFLFNNI